MRSHLGKEMYCIRPWLYVGNYRDSLDYDLVTADSASQTIADQIRQLLI